MCEKYKVIMIDYIEKGYVERILEEELELNDRLVWYFLYYFVIYFLKFDKVRVVYDCVVKYGGIFLNQ